MAAMIKGITVILYDRVEAGRDAFHAPIWEESPVPVGNVLVTPVGTAGIADEARMEGKRAEYELCIPRNDDHIWEDRRVEFFGQSWRTVGFSQLWIGENLPLDWNRKVKVERYG